jgi:hypothetical protein
MSDTNNYVMKKTSYNMVYDPDVSFYTYYQICNFENKIFHKYLIRKHLYNEYGDLINYKIYGLTRDEVGKLIRKLKPFQYKTVGYYDFKLVNYPSQGEILVVQSDILNKDCNLSGYRPISTL